jgi:hypothetical protein
MTAKTSAAAVTLPTPVILFGLDHRKKPIAATFPGRLCALALKAGQQLKLNALKVTRDDVADLAKRLPAGRVNASGKGLVPTVKQALYDQVLKLASVSDGSAAGSGSAGGTSSAAPGGSPKIPLNEAGQDGNPAGREGLPATWKDIGPNHLVLVQESRDQGWAEAIVISRKDDMLLVRWEGYSKYKPFLVHADAVALVNPAPSFKTSGK